MQNVNRSAIVEFIIILVLLVTVFLFDLKDTPFFSDESMWINQSSHLEDFFSGNFSAIAEQRLDLGLTMPTVPEYAIGLSRLIGGYHPAQLNQKLWEFNKSIDQNRADGTIPSADVLWWSRLLPSLMGVTSILITFYLIKPSFGVRISYIWLVLIIADGWLIMTLQRAMSESPLLFTIAIAMLAGFMAIRSFGNDLKSMRWSLLWLLVFGIFAGLAGQTKLNGLAIMAAGLAILILLTLKCEPHFRPWFLIIGLIGLGLAGFVFFVGVNPFFWNDPIGRTMQTLQNRLLLMRGIQARALPKSVVNGWGDSIRVDLNEIFLNLTSMQFPNSNYLKMILSSFGLGILTLTSWSALRNSTLAKHTGAIVILLVGFFASLPSLFTPLDSDRYFLLPVFFIALPIALGLDWFWEYVQRRNTPTSTAIPLA